jgi:YD repeat-containing protein
VQCAEEQKEALTYESVMGSVWEEQHNLSYYLEEGENHLRISPHDAIAKTGAGEHGEGEIVLRVDKTPPHNLTMSGLSMWREAYQLSETIGHVIIHVTDGEGGVASSGVKSISLYVDGREVGTPHGSCSAGPCTANGEWTLNGAELGAGQHTLTLSATDNAGNTETKELSLEVYSASPLAMGPGSVNPESGDFALEAADVQLSGGMGDLSVTRHYDSRNLKEGSEGPLGPQWSISLGSLASLEILPDGSAMIVGPDGLVHFTKNSEEKFVAPIGDSNLALEPKSGEPYKEYLLENRANGTTTRFTRPVGANAWMPTVSDGPVTTDTVTDTYKTAEVEEKTIVEPSLELAPHPSATCEAKKFEKGCRALEFDYASSTTAMGEAESEWGEYKGRLTRVTAIAWNPTKGEKGEMATVPVAEYAYDRQGRLRAEWDPRISPALKTVYGYDTEGHITAITPPGQETTAFLYGTIPSDTNSGRLLKMTRAPASAPLWSGEPVKNTEAPVITGLPEVGVRLAASEGHWSGSPAVYGYQWEHCNGSGGECSPVPGATNANYTPTPSEANSSLTVLVSATNGGGTVTASQTVQVEANQTVQGTPFGITTGSDGNLWFTNFGTNKIGKITPSGATTEYMLPRGSLPMGIALGPDGNVWFTDFSSDKICKITTSGVITEYALPAGSKPSGIVSGPDGNLWFSDLDTGAVGKITTSGVITEYALPAGSKPSAIAKGSDGNLWVADRGLERIYKVTTSGVITAYALPAGSQPEGIASGPEGDLLFTEFHSNKIGKITTSGVITEYTLPNESWPSGISSGPDGNTWFTDYKSGKIGKITPSGTITEYPLPSMNAPAGITSGPDGNLWFADDGDSEVGKITISGAITEYWLPNVEGEYRSPEPGSTIEYDVPVSGVGAPYEMGAKETEAWNEKSGPVEATAIFPSDEPQSWPASKYTRATIDYMDSRARTVNTATPGGGISTTQYNEYNEPEETLSAENRQTALAEGGNTVINAKRLTSYTLYVEEGTRIWESFGPIHEIKVAKGTEKIPTGSEIMGRNRVIYYYDEGAPAGETYDLVTKTVDVGESAATGEHFDVRTSTTSYSGQNNLGWTWREPTSTVTDPEGLKITHTTIYNEETGNIMETQGPASSGPGEAHDSISIYYTAGPNTKYPNCGAHIEWSGLPCETLPGKQPKTSGLPPLPEKTITYNMWNEPETITEAFGSTTRTRKTTFDEAGRALTSEITSSVDTPVPAITDHYSEITGALVKESETIEGKEKVIARVYNTLGQLTSYADADGNTTTYEYEGEGSYTGEKEKDGRLRHISDGKGNQTYSYNETTGLITKLVDSAAGTFTAAYNLAGRMTSETYPNNMTATYTYNSVGDTTSLEYKKNADCAKTCPEVWFGDTIVPSAHGEDLKQSSTLSEEPKYTYDAAGRLTEVQEIPASKGCVTRLYTYNVESDRTSLTNREPTNEGKCASEGGTTENHAYDEAGRLIDTGVTYDTFGNITKMPAADAGGAEISSSFYVDSQVASQTQNKETSTYYMDPAGRIRETVSTGKTASITIDHYDGSGSAISWVGEPEEKWTRNIPGIDGTLSATQTSSGTVTLLLHDLQGNVVATAALSETTTKVLTTYSSTEFGVPQSGTEPPKYAWLGSTGVTSESTTGTIVQDGITYVPQTGRPLQTQSLTVPIPQNAAKAYTATLEPWVAEGDAAAAAQQVVNAEQARAAAEQANQPPGVLPDGNPGWWCGGEYGACECDEETEGCGPDPAHGSNPWGCGVWVSWGHGLHLNEYLAVHGHWACAIEPAHIEIEIALLEVTGNKYVTFKKAKEVYNYPEGKAGDFSKGWTCEANRWYQAWVWGRTWDGWTNETTWYATAEDGHWDQCPEGVEDPTSGPDQFTS